MLLHGNKVQLKPLTEEYVTNQYVEWLNDYEMVRFLESRFIFQNKESLRQYILNCQKEHAFAFAIITNKTEQHIGNIVLNNINRNHYSASIGILIGNKDFHGQGIATESIKLLCDFAFKQQNLHRIEADIYENNIASQCAFCKAGFIEESRIKESIYFEGKFIDKLIFSKLNINKEDIK